MTREYVVVLAIDNTTGEPIYLGNIGCGNQGVKRINNANLYTERGARNLAAQYPDGFVAVSR